MEIRIKGNGWDGGKWGLGAQSVRTLLWRGQFTGSTAGFDDHKLLAIIFGKVTVSGGNLHLGANSDVTLSEV